LRCCDDWIRTDRLNAGRHSTQSSEDEVSRAQDAAAGEEGEVGSWRWHTLGTRSSGTASPTIIAVILLVYRRCGGGIRQTSTSSLMGRRASRLRQGTWVCRRRVRRSIVRFGATWRGTGSSPGIRSPAPERGHDRGGDQRGPRPRRRGDRRQYARGRRAAHAALWRRRIRARADLSRRARPALALRHGGQGGAGRAGPGPGGCLHRSGHSHDGVYVARCTVRDNIDVGAYMVHTGLALADRRVGDDYVAAEEAARAARAGAWSGTFTPRWQWREKQRNRDRGHVGAHSCSSAARAAASSAFLASSADVMGWETWGLGTTSHADLLRGLKVRTIGAL
jgi:hypothetical protein